MCRHEEGMTELDCSHSCSHHTGSGKEPAKVISEWLEVMEMQLNENKKNHVHHEIPYGPMDKQKIDVWGQVGKRMFVFFHGGYWIEGDRKYGTSAVGQLVPEDVAVACVGYEFASERHTLPELCEDAGKAVQVLLDKFPSTELIIGGHSAGAHLAFKAYSKLADTSRISALFLLCGVYQVEGLEEVYIGKTMGLTVEEAWYCTCRPEELGVSSDLKIVLLEAEHDTQAIKSAQGQMAEKLKERGFDVHLEVIPGSDHFTLVQNLGTQSRESELLKEIYFTRRHGDVALIFRIWDYTSALSAARYVLQFCCPGIAQRLDDQPAFGSFHFYSRSLIFADRFVGCNQFCISSSGFPQVSRSKGTPERVDDKPVLAPFFHIFSTRIENATPTSICS
ncbi:unnamed protein product, partial [Mesorhabditis spiculigera]